MGTPSEPPPVPRTVRALAATALAVLGSVRRAMGLLWGTSRKLTVVIATLTLCAGVMPAAIALVGKRIVDGVVRAVESGRAEDRSAVLGYVALELALVGGASLLRHVNDIAFATLRALFAQRVSEMVLEKALTLGLADFEDSEFYDRMARARQGASYRPLDLMHGVFALGQSVVTLGSFGGLLAQLSGWVLLLIVLSALPEFVATTRFSRESFRLFHWRTPETRKQNYYEAVLTSADHFKEVRLFDLGPLLLGRYREIFTRFWREDRTLTIKRGAWSFGLGLLSTSAFYGAYGWIVLQAMLGRVTLGDVSMFLMVFKDAQGTLGSVLHTVSRAYEDHLYLTTLFEFFDRKPAVEITGAETSGPDPRDGIRFEDVSFTYPGANKPALSHLSLHVPSGRTLALVGENGAGKTTLIKLLTRLYTPTEGRIFLDGRDLREWEQGALQRRIGVIFQDFARYQFVVGENIGVGDVRAFDDEARWREAAERGMAADFIEELPNKYATQLGKWFDDGQDLSVGQWQKIALSRAFMRRDADILVLDEPTASMDAAAEARVFERFRALAAHRTAVLISHRFSTVRMADTIAVLADGAILEQGTHDELIAKSGRYAELFFLQARGYR